MSNKNFKSVQCTHPDGREEWYQDGRLHRVGGPAIVHADGSAEWYLHGQRFDSEEDHQNARELARHDDHTLYRVSVPGQPALYVAGCRRLTLSEARNHWREGNSNRPPFIQALAKEV